MNDPRPSTLDLAERLRIFREHGRIPRLPTWWQVRQGAVEMTPYVISTDVTAEQHYRPWWGHPLARQPALARLIGIDHLATGSGLRSRLSSVVSHLQLTWHQGMPTFDLQLVMTHPNGLSVLAERTRAVRDGSTPEGRRRRRLAERFFVDPDGYYERFLEPGGWIDRARAMDFPSPAEDGAAIPHEFYSLVGFMEHCASAYPATVAEVGRLQAPAHLAWLATRRFREEGGLGWSTAHTVHGRAA